MNIDYREHKELWNLVKLVGYNGRRLAAEVFNGPRELSSYWSGGTRQMWHIVRLTDRKIMTMPECGGHWCQPDAQKINELPEGFCLINVCIGCYEYATIYFNANNLTPYLPKSTEGVPNKVKIVLHYTCSYKSSYAKISNFRFYQYKQDGGKMTIAEWESAKAEAVQLGYLNKAGAVTTSGRNLREEEENYLSIDAIKKWEAA